MGEMCASFAFSVCVCVCLLCVWCFTQSRYESWTRAGFGAPVLTNTRGINRSALRIRVGVCDFLGTLLSRYLLE